MRLRSRDPLRPRLVSGDPDGDWVALRDADDRGVTDLEYRGGVMYVSPGVNGVERGSNPSRARCVGFRAISSIVSAVTKSGLSAKARLTVKSRRMVTRMAVKYVS